MFEYTTRFILFLIYQEERLASPASLSSFSFYERMQLILISIFHLL